MSTTAMAIFQPFLPASATDSAASFLALSREIEAPYGFGIWANAGAAASAMSTVTTNLRIVFPRYSTGRGALTLSCVIDLRGRMTPFLVSSAIALSSARSALSALGSA